jgi:NAD(P)H-dependent FMN reductase
MSKKILVVLSSVRENRIADKILETVQKQLAAYDYEVTVADFKKTPLPLLDSPYAPAREEFEPTDANVIAWTKQVDDADAVLMLVAEYNYSFTPILKNAIDWVFKPWAEKPVALVGYGWVGGARAITHLRTVLGSLIAARALETEANLRFTKEIDLEGNVIDAPATEAAINTVLEELKVVLEESKAAAVV